ncbi:Phosphorylase b kinase regulatory subunit alpha [Sparganum proliferum]
MAYRKVPSIDEDRSRAYELEKCVVNLMRGILRCYMYQADKVEAFKKTQNPNSALHAKFDSRTCKPVVGDFEWGHLQIDAVSLYLLALAQMTAAGLRIIWTVSEVAFIQNLVFYIEPASRIPVSVRLAKAALESLNGLDLFGPQGGSNSTIHVLLDESQQCNTVLENMLPRESHSKETDAALLGIISYPAFAVNDRHIIEKTRSTVLSKLLGSYGCIRFMRDGYRTALEDSRRLHYEPWELRMFEGIECEWPLFFPYLILGACFDGDRPTAQRYLDQLEQVVLRRKMCHDHRGEDSIPQPSQFTKPADESDEVLYPIMPELYSLPGDRIDAELKNPHSQVRVPIGSAPHLWGQSLYILSRIIMDGLLLPGEIDPLGRRLGAEPKPDLVVQVVVLAEDESVKDRLAEYQVDAQTFTEASHDSGIRIYPAKVLSQIYKDLGDCPSLGLTGRTAKDIGVLSTSSLYRIGNTTFVFTPQLIDSHAFYVNLDVNFILDNFKADVAFLRRVWAYPGRPTFLLPVHQRFLKLESEAFLPSIVTTIKKLKSGYINGTRVVLGKLKQFESTSCIRKITFIKSADTLIRRQSSIRSSARRRRLTVSQLRPLTVEFDSPDISGAFSGTSTPSSSLHCALSPLDMHHSGSSYDREDYEGVQRTSLRRKSLALACAVSCDLTAADDDMQEGIPDAKSMMGNWKDLDDPSGDRTQGEDDSNLHRLRVGELPDSADALNANEPAFRRMLMQPPESAQEQLPPLPSQRPPQHPRSLSLATTNTDAMASFASHASGRSSQSGLSTPAFDWLGALSVEQLVDHLKQTDSLAEQAEILGRLKQLRGLDWDTGIEPDCSATVRSLLKEVYYRACQSQNWFILRYLAGLLEKTADQLANAVSSILLLQKQITVGLPPKPREKVIVAPLPATEIANLIQEACGEDSLMAMLTQELLLHLSMFARSHPALLANVLRLRVGLIIQLMGAELARSRQSSVEDALFALFSMSPFETNCLLSNLLSGNEIRIFKLDSPFIANSEGPSAISFSAAAGRRKSSAFLKVSSPLDISSATSPSISQSHSPSSTMRPGRTRSVAVEPIALEETRNIWSRRRKIDGSLNRVPPDFFVRTYCILERLQGLRIGEHVITTSLTKEMTKEELKFALAVESFINTVPTPEYRQLLVEATTVIGALVTHDEESRVHLNCIVSLDDLVANANRIFLEDQAQYGANATLCCAKSTSEKGSDAGDQESHTPTEKNPKGYSRSTGQLPCRGPHRICHQFYDTPPAGRFGTMAYMVRALAVLIGDSLPVSSAGKIAVNCAVA